MPEVDDEYHHQYEQYLLNGTNYVTFEQHPIPEHYQETHDSLMKYAYWLNYDASKPLNEMQLQMATKFLPYKIASYFRADWTDDSGISFIDSCF